MFVEISDIGGCYSKLNILFKIIGKLKLFLDFACKYKMEACPQMSYGLVFLNKEGPISSYTISKIPKKMLKSDS